MVHESTLRPVMAMYHNREVFDQITGQQYQWTNSALKKHEVFPAD